MNWLILIPIGFTIWIIWEWNPVSSFEFRSIDANFWDDFLTAVWLIFFCWGFFILGFFSHG